MPACCNLVCKRCVDSIHARLENQSSDKPNKITRAIPFPVTDMPTGTRLDIKLTKNTKALGLRILVANPW